MIRSVMILLCAALLVGCQSEQIHQFPWQHIAGREHRPLYRAQVPSEWKRIDPSPLVSLADTTLSLCEFLIEDPQGTVRIAIHNFPTHHLEQRIPPQAQIARWRQQNALASGTSCRVLPVSHGGFTGLSLQGPGILAYAMQLAVPHFRILQQHQMFQCCADYTIKATGPQELLIAHQDEIERFARSFELIEEIPSA